MKIAYSKYELEAKHSIQHRAVQIKRHGALLRVAYNDQLIGYADCHPWEILGDLPLDQQLTMLGEGNVTHVTARSMYYARLDAHARYRNENVFAGLKIPKSHFLITNIHALEDVSQAIEEGFTHFKLKMGLRLNEEIERLQHIIDLFPNSSYKLRIDLNLKLTKEEFVEFLERFKGQMHWIDFFEDPFCYHEGDWSELEQKYGIKLAADENVEEVIQSNTQRIAIFKPAIQSHQRFESAKSRVVVTSYLDHPIGQLAAAYTASKLHLQNEFCGLLSHRAYQPNAFSEQLSRKGPDFATPPGTGFGYDDLLCKLEWTNVH